MDSLLSISNALVSGSVSFGPIAPGIDGGPRLAVPVVAMGTGGLVTGPAAPSITGAGAAVLSVPVVAKAGGRISGPVVPGGDDLAAGLAFWSPDMLAFDLLILRNLRRGDDN